MDHLKRRKGEKSFFHSPAITIFVGLFCLVMLLNVVRVYVIFRNVDAEERDLKNQIAEKEAHARDLQAKLKMLESGEGVELEARSRLNFQKPGERVLIIVNDKNKTVQTSTSTEQSILARIKKWFDF
jgi:cell division protein FtsB